MPYWIIGIATTIIISFYLFISFYVFRFFLDRSFSKDMLFKGKESKEDKSDDTLHFKYEDIYINATDNVKLHSYVVSNASSLKWIICAHGYAGDATNLLSQIEHFFDCGYNVIAIDLRAHGKSQGKYCGLSYLDAKDIQLWIEWVLETEPKAAIALFGLSLGGASVLMTASNKLDERVKCVISDSAPADLVTQFKHIWSWFVKISPNIFLPTVNMWMKLFAKYTMKDASPIKRACFIEKPCLIIHGSEDKFVSTDMANLLYEKLKCIKELLIIPNANHTQAVDINPSLYWNQIDSFMSRYFK